MIFKGFVGPAYEHPSTNADMQRCINLFVEPNEALTQKNGGVGVLVGTPGLRVLASSISTGPLRALWETRAGVGFCISGSGLYTLNTSTWAATLVGSLLTSSGPVSIAESSTQVVIVDGTYGYVYASGTLTRITDADWKAADTAVYLDGYFIFNEKGTDRFFFSGSMDGGTYDALDFQTAYADADKIIALAMHNQQIRALGSKSVETYWNSGDADNPFQRVQSTFVGVGCIAAHSVKVLNGLMIWLGDSRDGNATVWAAESYQPQRISTYPIEYLLRQSTRLSEATAWSYEEGGHWFYCLNVPDIGTTLVWDKATGTWHERTHWHNGEHERHRAECHALIAGVHVVGDRETGTIYALEGTTYTDNTVPIVRDRIGPHLNNEGRRMSLDFFQLDLETGVGLDGGVQGSDPQVMLRISKDNGHTWGVEDWTTLGPIGCYQTRAIWRRKGNGRDFLAWVRISDPVPVRILGAFVELSGGGV